MNSKGGGLSKAEIYYIKNHYKTVGVDVLCGDLNRTKAIVEKAINKIKKEEFEALPLNAKNQFFSRSGATVMTENASVLGDIIKKKNVSSSSRCVTKIKNDQ